jgi:ceramide glucosyltransferase
MSDPVHLILLTWSGLAALWWGTAVGLVLLRPRRSASRPMNSLSYATGRGEEVLEQPSGTFVGSPSPRPSPRASLRGEGALPQAAQEHSGDRERLTVFKALPPVSSEAARAAITEAVGSFVRELDADSELVLGLPREAEADWAAALAQWRRLEGGDRLKVRVRPTPGQHANPKVAWLEVLSTEATGALWLWSDADIIAPPGLLGHLRAELAAAAGSAHAVTSAYCVRRVTNVAGLTDALFVNVEFLPGALLLGRLGTVRLSFGAAVLFQAETFAARVNWAELGASLADDYVLGQRLAPVRISPQLVETTAIQPGLGAALRHLHRWQRTIRWCRPGSFAALLVVMPLLGWLAAVLVGPGDVRSWWGLGGQIAVEALASAALMLGIGTRMPLRCWLAILAWPVVRVLGWVTAWLPLPVTWGEGKAVWRRPVRKSR